LHTVDTDRQAVFKRKVLRVFREDGTIHARDNVTEIGSTVRALISAGKRRTIPIFVGPISIR